MPENRNQISKLLIQTHINGRLPYRYLQSFFNALNKAIWLKFIMYFRGGSRIFSRRGDFQKILENFEDLFF